MRTDILDLQEHVMKRVLCVLFVVVGLVAGTGNVFAVSADANATVLAALAVSKTADLNFGQFAPSSTAGTVTIDASSAGTRSSTNVDVIGTTGFNAAAFDVTGNDAEAYTITLGNTTITLTSGANSMTVTPFTCSKTGTSPTFTSSLASGADTFYIGGTLNVGVSQATGVYTGTFDVTVAYN